MEKSYLREDLSNPPLFLIFARGVDRKVNGKRVKRDPAFGSYAWPIFGIMGNHR